MTKICQACCGKKTVTVCDPMYTPVVDSRSGYVGYEYTAPDGELVKAFDVPYTVIPCQNCKGTGKLDFKVVR